MKIDKYEDDKLFYDIIDKGIQARQETIKLARIIDLGYNTPNSLQATLGMIYRYEGETQSFLAKVYKADCKNLMKYVKQLVQRGLVIKVSKGKRKLLYLTEEGQKANEHFMRERGKLIGFIMDNIPEEQMNITRNTLSQMVELMNGYNKKLEEYKSEEETIKDIDIKK